MGQSSGFAICNLYTLTGICMPYQVPADKNLVVENASSFCKKASLDPVEVLILGDSNNSVDMPRRRESTYNGIQAFGGSYAARMYIPAGSAASAYLRFQRTVTQEASCEVRFVAHFVAR
jgi:hypothetical protein